MNLHEMGEVLRQERLRKGINLEDVVQKTKISMINLEALESGNKEQFPHPVYAKGFVRNYALFLGLDPDRLVDALKDEYSVAADDFGNDPTRDRSPVEMKRPADDMNKTGLLPLVFGILALAMVIGVAIYFFSSDSADEVPAPSAQTTQEAPAAEPTPVAPPMVPAQPEQLAAPEPVAEVAEPAAPAVQPQAEAAPAQPGADTAAKTHNVVITANQLCWIYAKVDGGDEEGGVTVDVTLHSGQSKVLRYEETLLVRLGNGGGVTVTQDGKPLDVGAEPGQVKTLNFPLR